MKTSRFAQGTRVRVQRGPFPLDPGLLGRTGLVLGTSDYAPGRYGVQLDGEARAREFREEELTPLTAEPMPADRAGSTGPSLR